MSKIFSRLCCQLRKTSRSRSAGEKLNARVIIVSVACLLVFGCGVVSHAQLSGQFGLGVIVRRIPTTLTGEIKLDTPSEFVMLEFAIASKAVLNVDLGLFDLNIDAAVNTAGPEHFVFKAPLEFRELAYLRDRTRRAECGSRDVVRGSVRGRHGRK